MTRGNVNPESCKSFIQGTILAPPISLRYEEVAGAPSGYKTYDFFANVNTNMGPMELMLETTNSGDIYQNAAAPDNPNETYASYVTIGASGANEAQTDIYGGAVDLGGGSAATFDTSNIDITWAPITGVQTGWPETGKKSGSPEYGLLPRHVMLSQVRQNSRPNCWK